MDVPSMEVTPPTPIAFHPPAKFPPTPKPKASPYTPSEYKEIFLDFYTFLTTLHYDPADLKIPPPEGWPNITTKICEGYKPETAIDVLRHLPYFESQEGVDIHYKSFLIDYSSRHHSQWGDGDWRDDMLDNYCEEAEPKRDPEHVIYLALGHESGGRDLLLDTQRGEIIEEMIRMGHAGSDDIKVFFADLKEAYRSLKLIPCEGTDTMEAWGVEERDEKITAEEVNAQTEKCWGTDLDVQYTRQIYREHGWPDAFRKEDAEKALDEAKEARGG